ncbi:hypothetical protein Tco_1384143 [Tanacetum coccineum]
MSNKMDQMQKVFMKRPQGALPSNTEPNLRDQVNSIMTRSRLTTAEPSIPPHVPPTPRVEDSAIRLNKVPEKRKNPKVSHSGRHLSSNSDSLLESSSDDPLADPSTVSSPTTDIDIIDLVLERFADEPLSFTHLHREMTMIIFFDLKSNNDEWKKLLYVLTSDSTLPEESSESSEIATLLSSPFENEDKVFNPGIFILVGTQIFNDESKDKDFKINILSETLFEDSNFLSISFDQELMFFLELTVIETLLLFSSKNEDKVFNPGILISKGVHSFILRLSHRTYETFKIINVNPNILNEGSMKIFCASVLPPDKGIRGESS